MLLAARSDFKVKVVAFSQSSSLRGQAGELLRLVRLTLWDDVNFLG